MVSPKMIYQAHWEFCDQRWRFASLAMCVGAFMSTIIAMFQERIARRYGKVPSTPEGRLYFSCIQSAFLPIGLFWFAGTISPSIHWIVPSIAIAVATMGLFSIYLAVFNYLADTYHRYASSALAAQSFCTCSSCPLEAASLPNRIFLRSSLNFN